MWYTELSKPLNLQKVQESPIRGGIIEESINDTHKWEAERMARNILVVEDDRNISDLIRMYLEKEGFEVRSAYDGGKAVEEFDKQVSLVAENPELYGLSRVPELAERGYRCAPMNNYIALYKVADGQIVVCRIVHKSRDYARLL